MNSDVLKSLGYLKKSLSMSNRAIANAVKRDPNDDVSDQLQDAINDLIDAIDFETSSPAMIIPVAPPPSIIPVPVPVPTLGATSTDDSGSGINFLDPS